MPKTELLTNKDKLKFIIKPRIEYYDDTKSESYNAFMNILVGGRGVGKTTLKVYRQLKKFDKKGSQFIYLRRYKAETKKCQNLLNNIVSNKIICEGFGDSCYKWRLGKRDIGYLIALSVAGQFKSVPFPNVDTIIFDEAILKPNGLIRYLDSEIEMLFEFISTVFRTRPNCKVYILGNNLDVFNPYYQYFKIPAFEEFYYDKERGIYIENIMHNAQLIKMEQQTGLYHLTKDTKYGEYHYENKLLVNENCEIIPKPTDNLYFCYSFICNETTLHIYNYEKGEFFYCEFIPKIKKSETCFNVIINNEINYSLCKQLRTTRVIKRLVWEYYNNNIKYNSPEAFSILSDLILTFR